MIKIKTKEEFIHHLEAEDDKVLVLKFSAEWCGPCRMLERVVSEIETERDDVTFLDVDVDEADEDFVDEYKVRNIPVLLFFKDGLQCGKLVGGVPKSSIIDEINSAKN